MAALKIKVQVRLQIADRDLPTTNGEAIVFSWEPAQYSHPAISGFRAYYLIDDSQSVPEHISQRGSGSISGSNLSVLWDGDSTVTNYGIDSFVFEST